MRSHTSVNPFLSLKATGALIFGKNANFRPAWKIYKFFSSGSQKSTGSNRGGGAAIQKKKRGRSAYAESFPAKKGEGQNFSSTSHQAEGKRRREGLKYQGKTPLQRGTREEKKPTDLAPEKQPSRSSGVGNARAKARVKLSSQRGRRGYLEQKRAIRIAGFRSSTKTGSYLLPWVSIIEKKRPARQVNKGVNIERERRGGTRSVPRETCRPEKQFKSGSNEKEPLLITMERPKKETEKKKSAREGER